MIQHRNRAEAASRRHGPPLAAGGLLFGGTLLVALSAAAQTPPPGPFEELLQQEQLTGTWGGLRPYLREKHGIDIKFGITQYGTGQVAGPGDKGFVYTGRGDLYVNIDGHKLGLWPGFFITSHTAFRWGGSTGLIGGQIFPVNTAATFPSGSGTEASLTSLVFAQALSENFIVSIGRYDLIDLFETWFTGGYGVTKFMNINLVVSPIGARVAPVTTYGGTVTAKVWGGVELNFGVFGTQGSQLNYDIGDAFDNGVTFLGGAKVPWTISGLKGQALFSAIGSTVRANSLAQTDRVLLNVVVPTLNLPVEQVRGAWMLSAMVEQYLVTNPVNPKQGFGFFVSAALTEGDPSPIKWQVFGGIAGNSPIPGRWEDTFGIGYFYNGNSTALKDALAPLVSLRDAQGFEAYYNLAVTKWFRVTADVQVLRPSARSDITTVLTFRGELRF